jgi:hypothetical protein
MVSLLHRSDVFAGEDAGECREIVRRHLGLYKIEGV